MCVFNFLFLLWSCNGFGGQLLDFKFKWPIDDDPIVQFTFKNIKYDLFEWLYMKFIHYLLVIMLTGTGSGFFVATSAWVSEVAKWALAQMAPCFLSRYSGEKKFSSKPV